MGIQGPREENRKLRFQGLHARVTGAVAASWHQGWSSHGTAHGGSLHGQDHSACWKHSLPQCCMKPRIKLD